MFSTTSLVPIPTEVRAFVVDDLLDTGQDLGQGVSRGNQQLQPGLLPSFHIQFFHYKHSP
jgi:hypothetical protein